MYVQASCDFVQLTMGANGDKKLTGIESPTEGTSTGGTSAGGTCKQQAKKEQEPHAGVALEEVGWRA